MNSRNESGDESNRGSSSTDGYGNTRSKWEQLEPKGLCQQQQQ